MEDDSFINSITVEACITYLKQYDNGRCRKKIYVFFVKLSMREIWEFFLKIKSKEINNGGCNERRYLDIGNCEVLFKQRKALKMSPCIKYSKARLSG